MAGVIMLSPRNSEAPEDAERRGADLRPGPFRDVLRGG